MEARAHSPRPTGSPAGAGPAWSPSGPRRLSDDTHALAERALSGEYGRSMADTDFALAEEALAGSSAPAGQSPDLRYAAAVRLIAERAPLRILPGELLVGSATLREAAAHQTPAAGVGSTSHTTLGFDRVLEAGYRGLRERIGERRSAGVLAGTHASARCDLDERGNDLLEAMRGCLEAAALWHRRHLDRLRELADASSGAEREAYLEVHRSLERVPEEPPRTFREAVQALWFAYAFQRLCGNWSAVGRIDKMLGPFLRHDLDSGLITLDEARELLAHFWIKGCEWIGAFNTRGSGDAQHYQNIVLSGVDPDGRDVTNEVTYLVLDVVEELRVSDFPIAVRISSRTPARLLRRIAELQRQGGGTVAVYNEDRVIAALLRFGYRVEEARDFANDGCWEVLIPGKTTFGYSPFDLLALLHEVLGLREPLGPLPSFSDFEELYAAFLEALDRRVEAHHRQADEWAKGGPPAPLVSLLIEDCIEKGRGYWDRGARYTALAPHAGGMANVADSLLVLRKLVFEERRLSLQEFLTILRADWEGHEDLRRLILSRSEFYGNDDDEADAMMRRVFDDYTEIVGRVREREGVLRPAGISTFGREIEWSRPHGGRRASPDGRHRGEVLATNFSPSPGSDRKGPTAVLRSCCKMDFSKLPNGTALELKVFPESVKGVKGLDALVSLLRAFVELGGWFLHIDVVDPAMLRDAQRHPEKYPNLAVRISGWSARFATLDENWQEMVIQRTQQWLR